MFALMPATSKTQSCKALIPFYEKLPRVIPFYRTRTAFLMFLPMHHGCREDRQRLATQPLLFTMP